MRIFWVLSLIFITLSANDCSKSEMQHEKIYNTWFHSYEEDTGNTRAYRPRSYDFPPSRGRTGFTIEKNGAFTLYEIAPTDGIMNVPGKWKMKDENTISVEVDSLNRKFDIVLVSMEDSVLRVNINEK